MFLEATKPRLVKGCGDELPDLSELNELSDPSESNELADRSELGELDRREIILSAVGSLFYVV
jgi:hypothetical protein